MGKRGLPRGNPREVFSHRNMAAGAAGECKLITSEKRGCDEDWGCFMTVGRKKRKRSDKDKALIRGTG